MTLWLSVITGYYKDTILFDKTHGLQLIFSVIRACYPVVILCLLVLSPLMSFSKLQNIVMSFVDITL